MAKLCLTLQPYVSHHPRIPCPSQSLNLLKLKSIESLIPSIHLILCHPLLHLPSIFPSIMVFSSELILHISWPKYWSLSISPSSEYSVLISFGLTGLISVQFKALKNFFSTSLKASVLQCSAFFMVQLSHPYMTTGKTIALIIWTFVGKDIILIIKYFLILNAYI